MSKKQSDGLSRSEMAFIKDPLNAPFPKSLEPLVSLQFDEDDRRGFSPALSDKEAFEEHCLARARVEFPEAFE